MNNNAILKISVISSIISFLTVSSTLIFIPEEIDINDIRECIKHPVSCEEEHPALYQEVEDLISQDGDWIDSL